MTERKEVITTEANPKKPKGALEPRQCFYVTTDEAYVVQPLDRVIVLTTDADVITTGITETPDFRCWVIDKDLNIMGMWVEEDELKVITEGLERLHGSEGVTTEWIERMAQIHPAGEANFLTRTIFDQAVSQVSSHTHTISGSKIYMSPSQNSTWTQISSGTHTHSLPSHSHGPSTTSSSTSSSSTQIASTAFVEHNIYPTMTGNLTYSGIPVTVSNNLPDDGNIYIINQDAVNAVTMNYDGMKWKTTTT